MAVFDVGQHVVNSAAGVITGSTAIDISSALTDLSATLESMEIGELVVLAPVSYTHLDVYKRQVS